MRANADSAIAEYNKAWCLANRLDYPRITVGCEQSLLPHHISRPSKYLYVACNPEDWDVVKIGVSTDVQKRYGGKATSTQRPWFIVEAYSVPTSKQFTSSFKLETRVIETLLREGYIPGWDTERPEAFIAPITGVLKALGTLRRLAPTNLLEIKGLGVDKWT